MAPTRRRSDAESLSGGEEAEGDRPAKVHRLSSGSRASSASTASPSLDGSAHGSAHGSATASTGASSTTHDHEEEEEEGDDGRADEHVADEHGGREEEEDEEMVEAQRSGAKGKGKRRAADVDNMVPEEDEEEMEEVQRQAHGVDVDGGGGDGDDDAQEDNRLRQAAPVRGVGGQEPSAVDLDTRANADAAGAVANGDAAAAVASGDADAAVADADAAAAAGESEGASSTITDEASGRKEGSRPPSGNKDKVKRKVENKKNRVKSEAGVVLKVYTENFMCHRKLTVKLCTRVNFINGRNGSGKSAVLAALQICLGAKAHLTHRAKKMTDFIRHGWPGDAVLEVTLLNNEHGFKFEEYGDSVTVRRTIRRPSGGGFALLDHDGVVKSRDKAEMMRMLDVFNIQIDNPCAVLDQENSKKFLQGNAHDKYAFFMRATDLDRILSDSKATAGEITKMKNGHHQAVEQFPKYKAVVDQLKAEVKEYQDLESLHAQILKLKERIVWAIVGLAEEERDGLAEALKKSTLKIEQLKERIAGFETEMADFAASKDEIKERFDVRVAETARLKDEVQKTSAELKAAQQPLSDLRRERSKLDKEKGEKRGAKEAAAKKLKAARDMARRAALDDKEKSLLDGIQRAEDSLANVGRMKEGRGGEEKILGLRTGVLTATEGADKARRELDDANKDLADRRAELHSVESGTFDPISAIGRYLPALRRRITQQAGRFESPPVGPLGACIQLKEEHEQFRVCIEGHLSKNLANFVVGSQRDKTTLLALMKEVRGRQTWRLPTIIVQPPQARHRPPQNPPGCLQIMQAINVTNDQGGDQSFNCLVDQCSIEKICLFASKADAEKTCLIGQSGSYKRMPHGMFEAYYPSRGGKSCNKFTVSDGNLQTRTNIVNSDTHRRVLGVDQQTQLREARARVEQAITTVAHVRGTADSEVGALNRARAALEKEEAERKKLEMQESQLGREKGRLSMELMALQAEKSGATDPTEELQRELDAATEELNDVVKQLASLEEKIVEMSASVDPLKKAADEARKAHKESSAAAGKISEELEAGGLRETEHRRKVTRAQAALTQLNKDLEEQSTKSKAAETLAKEEARKGHEAVKNYHRQQGAEWDGCRVAPGADVEALRSKLAKKKDRLEREQKKRNLKGKSLQEVQQQLIAAMKHRDAMQELAGKLGDNMTQLSGERGKRLAKWKKMRNYASRTLSTRFNEYLRVKGAAGEVNLDHHNETMDLMYQKDSSNDSSQCEDVRQLSGGERSFATLAMLLAMGKSNECPFRIMDEFDVFMDAVSRNVAIKQMMEYASRDKTRQFILITPQDLSSVQASDTVKIIRMKPPRKGDHNQTTLEEAFGGGAS